MTRNSLLSLFENTATRCTLSLSQDTVIASSAAVGCIPHCLGCVYINVVLIVENEERFNNLLLSHGDCGIQDSEENRDVLCLQEECIGLLPGLWSRLFPKEVAVSDEHDRFYLIFWHCRFIQGFTFR